MNWMNFFPKTIPNDFGCVDFAEKEDGFRVDINDSGEPQELLLACVYLLSVGWS